MSEKRVFGGGENLFYRKRMREMKSDFALKVFKQNTTRWIEDLLRCYQESVDNKNHLDGSKCYREAIGQIETFSMDRESVERLSRQIPDSSMDRNCDKIYREKKSKGLDR